MAGQFLDFLDNLADALGDAGEQTTEEIIQELEIDGFPAREVLGNLKAKTEIQLEKLRQQMEENA